MHDVIIVGGGPVGLYLANLLVQRGIDVVVLEKRAKRSHFSRAIGIHPPALEAFRPLGIAEEMIAAGIPIREGILRYKKREWARLSFETVRSSYRFVLSLPQCTTEQILEASLHRHAPGALRTHTLVEEVHDYGTSVSVDIRDTGGSPAASLTGRFVVGADGIHSTVRSCLGIRNRGLRYPDTYLMGDFADSTTDGSNAVLYFEPDGVVESFPLPGGIRRWIVHTGTVPNARAHPPLPLLSPSSVDADNLCEIVYNRTGIWIDSSSNSMISSFGAARYQAERFFVGCTALIGDAAHEISPIGGQGMTLGWLDALALADILSLQLHTPSVSQLFCDTEIRTYERKRIRSARIAARHAEWNMRLGRPMSFFPRTVRNTGIFALAHSPLRSAIAQTFTMHNV